MRLTDAEREAVAQYVEAAWAAKSDRGFAEGWCVRDIVLDLVRKLEGER